MSRLADFGVEGSLRLPRPMLNSGNLDFSFSGLKTAVLTAVRRQGNLCEQGRADIARAFVDAIVDVLAAKSRRALEVSGLKRLVVAGGVGANAQLRIRLNADARRDGTKVHFPPLELCTDNGAMIALAGLAVLRRSDPVDLGRKLGYAVRPRWSLSEAAAG
jgi:N6-L-threonylcarbamoyladenine synthase